ncbi:PHP domain-containing protein [Candidatus Woesearchaeota archaeon]|nr:PHP domain-containing protein [Candidatus Woesearchaeota archaeon]
MEEKNPELNKFYKKNKNTKKLVEKISAIDTSKLTDEELKNTKKELREKLLNGETEEQILPELFARTREVMQRFKDEKKSWKILGQDYTWFMVPYEVQYVGAIALNQNSIAEMKTGEGKTLAATMPLMLNSLAPEDLETTIRMALREIKLDIQQNPFQEITLKGTEEELAAVKEFLEAQPNLLPNYKTEKGGITFSFETATATPRVDMHNHTTYSDGNVSIKEAVEKAKERKIGVLGITDHFLTNKLENPAERTISNSKRMQQYIEEIKKARQEGITVLAGIEIDSSLLNPAISKLPYGDLNQLDFALFEYIQDSEVQKEMQELRKRFKDVPKEAKDVLMLEDLISIRKKLSVPVGLAHTNITRDFTPGDMKKLAENNIFIEVHANPSEEETQNQGTLSPQFWDYLKEFANYGGKISVGSDTHDWGKNSLFREKIYKLIEENGLTGAVINLTGQPQKKVEAAKKEVSLKEKRLENGKGSHLATVNDYLAIRDAQWMGPIYEALGFTVGIAVPTESLAVVNETIKRLAEAKTSLEKSIGECQQKLEMSARAKKSGLTLPFKIDENSLLMEMQQKMAVANDISQQILIIAYEEKKKAYKSDIVYGTNSELGFDFLRDNTSSSLEKQAQRGRHYCVVDEIDSVIIDDGRTPLILSSQIPYEAGEKECYLIFNILVKEIVAEQQKIEQEFNTELEKKVEKELRKNFSKISNLPPTEWAGALTERQLKKLSKLKNAVIKEEKEKFNKGLTEEAEINPVPWWKPKLTRKYEKRAVAEKALYTVDEEKRIATFTDRGWDLLHKKLVDKELIKGDNIQDPNVLFANENSVTPLIFANLALEAYTLFQKGKHYIVMNGEVLLIDQNTGRISYGRQYSGGVHQAIEAKELRKVGDKTASIAEIAQQNYFLLYEKLAGMTGTAKEAEKEFNETIGLKVKQVPTNKKIAREDKADVVYLTKEAKLKAIAKDVKNRVNMGQPVLVGTSSIEKSEELSKMFEEEGITHRVLNAGRTYQKEKEEAEIISKAGQKGAVTIATNMAGRGVDILLENGVAELGGLYVLGSERNEDRRIDNQLSGRSGRQGNPGESRFYVSTEDDLIRLFGQENVWKKILGFALEDKDDCIEDKRLTNGIKKAQEKVQAMHAEGRKYMIKYDNALNPHREQVYALRKNILEAMEGGNIDEYFTKMINNIIMEGTTSGADGKKLEEVLADSGLVPKQASREEVSDALKKAYKENKQNKTLEAKLLLKLIDHHWINDYVESAAAIKDSIWLQGYAQKEPLYKFIEEASSLYEMFLKNVQREAVAAALSPKIGIDLLQYFPEPKTTINQ